jgi:hypothetical protein
LLAAKDFDLSYNNDIDVKYSATIECGLYDSRALYATFGYEKQIFTCKEVMLNFNIDFNNDWSMLAEFAPVYGSLKNERKVKRIYEKWNGKEIDGGTKYVDWYKNLGTKIYNIGNDFPFRELYIKNDYFKIGRQINALSFSRDEVMFGEDAWFSPLGYFFSKDLYNGLVYNYNNNLFDLNIEFLSGDGNPAKNHIYYLGNEGNSNLKSNNTPIVGASLSYNMGIGRLFVGAERTRIGSTYSGEIKEGKHLKETYIIGGIVTWEWEEEKDLKIYYQYTTFKSGLNPHSSQASTINTTKEINQSGYFIGTEYRYDRFKFGFVYEKIDRYDYRAFKKGAEMGAKQESFIGIISYQLNKNISFEFAYHHLKNPLSWVSDVLPSRGNDRYRLNFKVGF